LSERVHLAAELEAEHAVAEIDETRRAEVFEVRPAVVLQRQIDVAGDAGTARTHRRT
jgi:hypothetical protein